VYSLDQLQADLQAFNQILAKPHQYSGARRDRLKNKVAKLTAMLLAERIRLGMPVESYLMKRVFVSFVPDQSYHILSRSQNHDDLLQQPLAERTIVLDENSSSESEDEEDLIHVQNVAEQKKEIETGYSNPFPIGPKRLTGWQVIGLAVGTAAAVVLGYGAYKYYTKTVVLETKSDDKTAKTDDKTEKNDKTAKTDDKTDKTAKTDEITGRNDKTEKTDDKTGKKESSTEKQDSPSVVKQKLQTWWNRHSFYDVVVNRCQVLYSQLSPREVKQAKHRTERHHDLIKEKLLSGYSLEDLLKTTMPHRNTPYLTKNEYLRIMAENHLHDHRSSKIELNEKNLLVNVGILPNS
jgi:hypothetical protein